MAIYNNDRDPNEIDWEKSLKDEISEMTLDEIKNKYIKTLKETLDIHKEIDELNEKVIKLQQERIADLEATVENFIMLVKKYEE